jgi:hypothetical protein
MPLLDPALPLRGQLPENLTEAPPQISIQCFSEVFKNKNNEIFALSPRVA